MGDVREQIIVRDGPIHDGPGNRDLSAVSLRPCGACGGEDTVCVHSFADGCNIGYWLADEFLCRTCGKHTSYETDYES